MYMISRRPYTQATSRSCTPYSCFNLQYFKTSYGLLKIVQIILGCICQTIMLFYGAKYIPTIGTSYESFLMTIAGCLMTTTVISVSYFLSKNTEVLVRSTLFEIIFGLFAATCYFGSSSLLTIVIYATLYPIIMTISFISLFSALLLAHTLGFVLGILYAIDAYWAFKYYNGFL